RQEARARRSDRDCADVPPFDPCPGRVFFARSNSSSAERAARGSSPTDRRMNYPELPGKIRHDICEWWKTVHADGHQPWREALQELKARDEFPILKLGVDLN